MKPLVSVLLTAFLIPAASSVRAVDTYNIDPAHTTVGFAVTHLVINTVRGKFTDFTGSVSLDGTTVKEAKATIQAKSINTGIEKRDNHLRSADFFDVQAHPTITFQAKRVEKKGDESVVYGDFTIHGVTKEIALPIKVKGPIKDPWGTMRVGLEAKAKINRTDFGLKWNQVLEAGGVMVGDEVEIEINAEAVKAAPKA